MLLNTIIIGLYRQTFLRMGLLIFQRSSAPLPENFDLSYTVPRYYSPLNYIKVNPQIHLKMEVSPGMIALMVCTIIVLISILVGFCLYPKCYGCWAWRRENAKPKSEQNEEWRKLYNPGPAWLSIVPGGIELQLSRSTPTPRKLEEGRRDSTAW